jgi:hypothetical protein
MLVKSSCFVVNLPVINPEGRFASSWTMPRTVATREASRRLRLNSDMKTGMRAT